MADHDDDWDDWDDDQDVEPYVPDPAPQATSSPADPEPTVDMPAAAAPIPHYDDETGESDDGMLAPPPIEEFASKPAVARSRGHRTRARAVTQSGSAEIDPVPVDEPDPAPQEPSTKSGCLGIAVVVLLVSVILAVIAWALVTMGPLAGLLGDEEEDGPIQVPQPEPSSTSAVTPTSTAAAAVESAQDAADEECSESAGATVAGNGPGSRDSGTDVILAFDHAYYVDRNGTTARGFMSEEITGTTAESLQEAIDALPEDTAHCLKMTPAEDEEDVYKVDLIVFQNSGQELVRTEDEQTIYVEEVDGEYTIIGIINE